MRTGSTADCQRFVPDIFSVERKQCDGLMHLNNAAIPGKVEKQESTKKFNRRKENDGKIKMYSNEVHNYREELFHRSQERNNF